MYVVEIKPSARRRARAVGEWINRRGPIREFDTKPLARAWARDVSGPDETVWIQDAVGGEPAIDGYLVSGPRPETTDQQSETQTALGAF